MLNPKIKSPMLVGLRRPMILLPISNVQEIDLKLVLTHELMHLKRKDLCVKMLALLAETLHWFNPFVHVLRKDVNTWGNYPVTRHWQRKCPMRKENFMAKPS
ncbi:MAG TPA: M56 family metallopeptidase [Clostridiaceae bacterium]|nr:M56 family metallopeptidase [Clostridiaceae bacterium]